MTMLTEQAASRVIASFDATCPCFPGTCRGDAVNGRLANGQRCKATIPVPIKPSAKFRFLRDTTYAERSWPEDRDQENGFYTNDCVYCLRTFTGNKRRVVCKSCATTQFDPDEPSLLFGQLDDFMYHGFGASDDTKDIRKAFMALGLSEQMANDIMTRIVHPPMRTQVPIGMILHCPNCGVQHIDAPEPSMMAGDAAMCGGDWPDRWTNPPHRSHLCHECGHIWRPADVPTNGVAEIQTKGKEDSPRPLVAVDRVPRGASHNESGDIITRAAAQAGIPIASVTPLGWNMCHRIVDAAHKAGFNEALKRVGLGALQLPGPAAEPVTYCWLVELFESDGTGNSAEIYSTGFVDIGGHVRSTRKAHEARRYTRERAEQLAAKYGSTLTGTWRAVKYSIAGSGETLKRVGLGASDKNDSPRNDSNLVLRLRLALQSAWPYVSSNCTIASVQNEISTLMNSKDLP